MIFIKQIKIIQIVISVIVSTVILVLQVFFIWCTFRLLLGRCPCDATEHKL
jgi:hypothetical protein